MTRKYPFTIAVIGGVASGKSTVLHFFKNLNIDCFSADEIARDIVKVHEPAYEEILKHLGPKFLLPNLSLNREKLREKLLKDQDLKQWLENLTHPLIRQKLHDLQQKAKSAYCILEIPLLKDKKDYVLDRVLLIEAKLHHQKSHLTKRGLSSKEITSLLDIQIPLELRRSLADDILINEGSLEDLKTKIEALHIIYLNLAKNIFTNKKT